MVPSFSKRSSKLPQLAAPFKSRGQPRACPPGAFCYNKLPKMIAFKSRLRESIYERLKAVFPVALEDLDMAPTPDPKMGDLALTFPFQLAKTLKKAPRAIAQEAVPLLASVEGVVKADVAGGGFLNLWLDKAAVFAEAIRMAGRTSLGPEEDKIVIEHTNINP